jgi:hypothetical protein
MNQLLVMRIFGENRRTPRVSTVKQDGITMYYKSRYVIVLDEHGTIVEKVNHRRIHSNKKNNLATHITVLAPVVYKNHRINQAVVLEIGVSVSTPYTRFEYTENKRREYYGPRMPVAHLSTEAQIKLLPDIFQVIQTVIDEELEHRATLIDRTRTEQCKHDRVVLYKGKSVTISKEDEVLIYALLKLDIEFRRKNHLNDIVWCIQTRLMKMKAGEYSEKELKRRKDVQEIAYYIAEGKFSSFILNEIRRMLGKPEGKVRHIFEQILEAFKIRPQQIYEVSHLYETLHAKWSKIDPEIKKLEISLKTQPKKDKRRLEAELRRLKTAKEKSSPMNKNGSISSKAKGCVRVVAYPSLGLVKKKHPEYAHKLHGGKLKRIP